MLRLLFMSYFGDNTLKEQIWQELKHLQELSGLSWADFTFEVLIVLAEAAKTYHECSKDES